MDTLAEIRTALRSDLNVSENSSLFPQATLDLAIYRAYITASKLFRWPALSDAKTTSSEANQEYYTAPSTWMPDSIWRLEVDGTVYGEDPDGSPMDFSDYLLWKADNPNSTSKKWSVHHLNYYIYPTPTANGSNNISIWGQKNITKLVNDSDETIFSGNMPECNLAIELEALSILKNKGEVPESGKMMNEKAEKILSIAYRKIKENKAQYEKVQPRLNVPDFFARSATTAQITGNFE